MREIMLELLTYEPYGKLSAEEEAYISEILAGKYQQPLSMLHDLFSGFYAYVQNGDLKDTEWLRDWKSAYHQNKNYTNSTKSGRSYYPLLFKKICFYMIVRGDFSDVDFCKRIALPANRIRKWGISAQFRRFAEADTYSVIRSFRSGVKKEYIVSLVKKLYYEAGRQASQSTILKDLPRFVDVFAGTAAVAASVVSDGCPPPIVNDYDPIMVCFAWAFTHCQKELRKRIADFHNDLMKENIKSKRLSYDEKDYERHHDPDNLLTSPKKWDTPDTRRIFMKFYGYSKKDIAREKKLAQCHRDFIMRIRSSYKDVKKVLDFCNRDRLRDINFNISPPHSINRLDDILDYALAVFYYYSFAPSGTKGNIYHETIVNTSSYFSYLSSLNVDLTDIKPKNRAIKAKVFKKMRLQPASLELEREGEFSRHMKGAKFYTEDFRKILQSDLEDRIYYLDSPYFLTTGYDVGFSDDDHRDMLDLLQGAAFKWIFSMQYNPSVRCKCTSSSDEAERKKKPPIIRDYGTYYRGFYASLVPDADGRTYMPTNNPAQDASGLFAILFDVDEAKKKWSQMNEDTKEMLVVNFDCLRAIPLHDTAVVLPFELFLQYADEGKDYAQIVQAAIEWRKENIERHHTGGAPV